MLQIRRWNGISSEVFRASVEDEDKFVRPYQLYASKKQCILIHSLTHRLKSEFLSQ